MNKLGLTAMLAPLALIVPDGRALALVQSQSTTGLRAPALAPVAETTSLPAITVYGQRIPLPVQLQMFKKALHRPWSSAAADRYELVCRWRHVIGTHITQRLYCETNRQHQRQQDAISLGFTNGLATHGNSNAPGGLARGGGLQNIHLAQVSGAMVTLSERQFIKRGTFAPILKKLPSADASYTFRVTDHGKPVLDYVFKHGELVHVYHYVYKNGKNGKRLTK